MDENSDIECERIGADQVSAYLFAEFALKLQLGNRDGKTIQLMFINKPGDVDEQRSLELSAHGGVLPVPDELIHVQWRLYAIPGEHTRPPSRKFLELDSGHHGPTNSYE